MRTSPPARKRLAALWPFGLFAILPACILPEVFAGKVFVGYGDRLVDFMTAMTLSAEALRARRLPLWDPYIFAGTLGLGQTVLRFVYPLNLIVLWLFPGHIQAACSWRIVVELFLELSAFFLFFRKALRDDALALFAALGASLCTATIQNFSIEMITGYMPALILWLLWDWETRSLRLNILGLSGALFLQLSGGFVQQTIYWLLFCWAVSAARCLARHGVDWKPVARLAVIWAASLAVAVALDTLDLVPFLQAQGRSNRVELPFGQAISWGQAWYFAVRLAFPYFLGWSPDGMINYPENYPVYCGVPCLIFAAVAMRRPLSRRTLPWLLVFVLVSVSTFRTPFYVVPWLLFSRAPLIHPRATLIAALALVFLAAEGLALFRGGAAGFQRSCVAQTVVGAAVLALFVSGRLGGRLALLHYLPAPLGWPDYVPPDAAARLRAAVVPFLSSSSATAALMAASAFGRLRRRAFEIGVCVVLAADLLFFAHHGNVHRYFSADSRWYRDSPVTRLVGALPDAGQFRFGFESRPYGGAPWADLPAAGGYHPGLAFRSWGFAYNENIPYHLHGPGGLSGFFDSRYFQITSLKSSYYREVHEDYSAEPALADLLSIKYFVVSQPPSGDPRIILNKVLYQDGKTMVLAKPDPVPRFHLACRARLCPQRADVLVDGLARGLWNLRDTALLGVGDPLLEQFKRCGGFNGRLSMRETAPERLEGRADLHRPALLVVEDSWAPGWRAFVNGREAPIHLANFAFRAVALPAGVSDVELRYEFPGLGACKAAIVAALLILAGMAAWPWAARLWRPPRR